LMVSSSSETSKSSLRPNIQPIAKYYLVLLRYWKFSSRVVCDSQKSSTVDDLVDDLQDLDYCREIGGETVDGRRAVINLALGSISQMNSCDSSACCIVANFIVREKPSYSLILEVLFTAMHHIFLLCRMAILVQSASHSSIE
ncbi:hypothetical protein PENTCL1PPCAC_24585, partial [Pristionchus entomophagus]